MSLADLLASIDRFDQLPGLARELGLEPTWHELSLEAVGLSEPIGRAALIGRRENFLCLGVEVGRAGRSVKRVTRALAARGGSGLVLGLDSTGRTLSFGVAAADCPVLQLDLARPSPVDLKRLERGAAGGGSGIELALRWAEALASRGLGTRFFLQFRRTLDRAVDGLPTEIPRRDRHALALLQLSRVLFLYFVQEKGWLDGRPRFLREELDRRLAGRGRIHHRFLVPLFFGTLNRRAADRRRPARELGRIPFLNGGLFEPHRLERRWPVGLSDSIWRDTFDELFERYHFTLNDREDETAIGPDMLGRVFEGVMDPDLRRDTGAFFTPSRLVGRMVEASLRSWARGLELELGSAAALPLLRSITVLDPAVGSGAFLLGMLDHLTRLRVAAGESAAAATRAVVGGNLFGVDLNPNAVRLAELRLWLRVIEAEPAGSPERVGPLPNLDAFVRQGDSLREPFRSPGGTDPVLAAEMARCRRALARATGPAKQELIRTLRRAELRAGRQELAQAVAVVAHRIGDLVSAGRTPGLFGERTGLSRSQRAALRRLRTERNRLNRLARGLDRQDQLPWFHYGSHFAEVAARGGFDLVVGNPPWIRAEALPPNDRAGYKERYRWFRAGRSGRPGYGHQPDLSVAFLERGLELVRPGGTVGFLLPAKLATAQYGALAREALARETTIDLAADLTRSAARAFDATVYPLALVVRRLLPGSDQKLATQFDRPAELPQRSLGRDPWQLTGAGSMAAGAFPVESHPRLGGRYRCRLGVKTGLDRIFLDPPIEAGPELLRPALRGRDLGAWSARPTRGLLWTHDQRGHPLPIPPRPAASWLERHRTELERRADHQGPRYWQLFRTGPAVAPHRVVWADLSRELEATPLVGRLRTAIPLNTCYLIATPTEAAALALAAWLNSTLIRGLARERATVAASGFARFDAATVESLPFPDAAVEDPILIRLAREAMNGELAQTELDRQVGFLLRPELGRSDDGSC